MIVNPPKFSGGTSIFTINHSHNVACIYDAAFLGVVRTASHSWMPLPPKHSTHTHRAHLLVFRQPISDGDLTRETCQTLLRSATRMRIIALRGRAAVEGAPMTIAHTPEIIVHSECATPFFPASLFDNKSFLRWFHSASLELVFGRHSLFSVRCSCVSYFLRSAMPLSNAGFSLGKS